MLRSGEPRTRDASSVLTASVSAVPALVRPSERVPVRSVPSKPPPVRRRLEALLTGRNGPERDQTVANRARTALTGAVRTGLHISTGAGVRRRQWEGVSHRKPHYQLAALNYQTESRTSGYLVPSCGRLREGGGGSQVTIPHRAIVLLYQ